MQKKTRLTAMTLVLILALSLSAGATARYHSTNGCTPEIMYQGTTVSCSVEVQADSGSDISVVLRLYHVVNNNPILLHTWPTQTGVTSLDYTGTYPVTHGETYMMTANVEVDGPNGYDNIYKTDTATCT